MIRMPPIEEEPRESFITESNTGSIVSQTNPLLDEILQEHINNTFQR